MPQCRVKSAAWSSDDAAWTVETVSEGQTRSFTCNFLWMCQGYYDHEKPYIPDWPGKSDYKGMLVHAQLWDPATDYTGKRVLIIGSGATAATVIPAMAETAADPSDYFRLPANRVVELGGRLEI